MVVKIVVWIVITVSNPCVVGTDKQVVGFLMIMLPATHESQVDNQVAKLGQ